jgi:hypothetical protein
VSKEEMGLEPERKMDWVAMRIQKYPGAGNRHFY